MTKLTEEEFRTLLDLMMVSDPWQLSEESRSVFEFLLNTESIKRGYDAWIVAYHEFTA